MQSPRLSLHSILEALDLDPACISLLEQTHAHELTHANMPEAVYAAVRTIGNMLNASQKANQLAEHLEERIDIISHKLKFIAEESKPNVWFVNDVSPMTALHHEYLVNLVRIAGGVIGTHTPESGLNPDVLIIISDKSTAQLLNELPDALSMPVWSQTTAVKNGHIYIIHNGKYLRQPGALIADDAEILAEILQPKYFIFGRDEDVWMKFDLAMN